jgi:hypothetical protein
VPRSQIRIVESELAVASRRQSALKIASETMIVWPLSDRTLLIGPVDAPLVPHLIPFGSDRTLPGAARTGLLAAGSRRLCQQRFRFAQEALSLGVCRPARILHALP